MKRRVFLAGLGALALSGCSSDLIGPPPAGQIYPVMPDFSAMGAQQAPTNVALSVLRPDVPGGLATDRIALFQPDGTQDFYANAVYPDRLPAIIQRAMVDGFERAGATAVSREQDALHADFSLLTEVKDFAAHYAARDGIPTVTVSIVGKLVRSRGREIVGAIIPVTRSASAGVNSTAAVTATMRQLLGQCVSEIVHGALQQAAAAPPAQ